MRGVKQVCRSQASAGGLKPCAIVRKGEPVLVINPKTFEPQAVGKLEGMSALPPWQQREQNAGTAASSG